MSRTHARAPWLTVAELCRTLRAMDQVRDRFLLALMVTTGMRVNEAVGLTVGHLYDDDGNVRGVLRLERRRTKGRTASRDLPVNDTLRELADSYRDQLGQLDQAAPMFVSRHGNPLSNRQARRVLTRSFRAAGLETASSHSLRRTAAVHMRRAGTDVRVIQTLLGHANIAQTQDYLDGPELDEKALAAAKLNLPLVAFFG